jgi:hypothetical protein
VPGAPWAGRPQRRSSNTQWIVAGALTAVVAIVLAFVVISRSGDGDGDGPRGAAVRLLEASKNQDLAAAQATLCSEDVASGVFTDELSTIHVVSYTINEIEERGDVSVVHVSMQTTDEGVDDARIPVVKDDHGGWKVCFARLLDDLDVPDTSL